MFDESTGDRSRYIGVRPYNTSKDWPFDQRDSICNDDKGTREDTSRSNTSNGTTNY